jgi:hypothetical protein
MTFGDIVAVGQGLGAVDTLEDGHFNMSFPIDGVLGIYRYNYTVGGFQKPPIDSLLEGQSRKMFTLFLDK